MNKPYFTTSEARIARLQENYDDGANREKMQTAEREKRDLQCLGVSNEKLLFLFQNAMEGYSTKTKNQKVKEYNETYLAAAPPAPASEGAKPASKSRFRFM